MGGTQQSRAQQNLGATRPDTRLSVPLKQIKAVKEGTYKVKKDKDLCCITGLAITKDGRKLMTDRLNNVVKLFSQDMKFLSSISVPDKPRDIAVISDKEAVVSNDSNSLVILDISGSQPSIKTTKWLSYDIRGVSRYNDKLVITSPDSKPPSVKLIDQTGKVYWSVSSDQQGQPLFSTPRFVSSHCDGRSSTMIVTDSGNHTLTLLNGDTGEVIAGRQLEGKCPEGVTTDSVGNIYVCYWSTSEVSVLSGDLSVEKIILSTQDGLNVGPQVLGYDDITHKLIISHELGDSVDCFKLSELSNRQSDASDA